MADIVSITHVSPTRKAQLLRAAYHKLEVEHRLQPEDTLTLSTFMTWYDEVLSSIRSLNTLHIAIVAGAMEIEFAIRRGQRQIDEEKARKRR